MSFARTVPPDAETRQGIEDAYDAEVMTLDDALRALVDGNRDAWRAARRAGHRHLEPRHRAGDHGGFGHGGSLYDESIDVPLVVARSRTAPMHSAGDGLVARRRPRRPARRGRRRDAGRFRVARCGRCSRELPPRARTGLPSASWWAAAARRHRATPRAPAGRDLGQREALSGPTTGSCAVRPGCGPREAAPAPETDPPPHPCARRSPPWRARAERKHRSTRAALPVGRPSILLVVFDTTRSDAVSSYGAVAGTTPYTDTLAAAGLRYTHACSSSNWTLPSRLTLFTALRPSAHGVHCGNDGLSPRHQDVAERLARAGYEPSAPPRIPGSRPPTVRREGSSGSSTCRARRGQKTVASWMARSAGRRHSSS